MKLQITVVHACQRDGRGGSPTAVVDETSLSEAERRALPGLAGTSHVVFIATEETRSGQPAATLRFFTAAGELPACGHGTVAALAVLAERAGVDEYETVLRSGGRTFLGHTTGGDRHAATFDAAFDPGPVELRTPAIAETEPILSALGIDPAQDRGSCHLASVGKPRMLVRVPDRRALADLYPDLAWLRDACDRQGLLGCYVYSTPAPDGRAAARMFAPSIGVAEDIANANSTACLAAQLTHHLPAIAVDMGDSLGQPATVTATTRPGPAGPQIRVGGSATITGTVGIG